MDYCDAGRLWDPVASAYFYSLEPSSFELTPLSSQDPVSLSTPGSNLTSFFYFTGIWGDAQYPDAHPLQKTVPYFSLKRFVSGPQGPIVKGLVRKGLFPDDRRTKPWVQWGIELFLAWYPCCIRGWRKWISGLIFAGSLVALGLGVGLGIKHMVKKRTTISYKRLDTEIPLDDLGYSEDVALHNDEDVSP